MAVINNLIKINKKFIAIAAAWFWSYLIFYWIFDDSGFNLLFCCRDGIFNG